jgi:trimeric autotransporter adhesin
MPIPSTGLFFTDDLSLILNPVANETAAWLTVVSGTNPAGTIYKWTGSAWAPTTGPGSAAPNDATYITQTPNAGLSNEQALNALTSGLMKQASGVVATAVAGVDYVTPGGTGGAVIVNAPLTGDGSSGSHLAIPAATSSVNGYLTSADWATFNAKQPAGSYLTGVTVDAPLSGAGTSGSHLSMPAATGSVNGYLTSTDWTTFNAKAPIASPTFTGTVTVPTLAMSIGADVAIDRVTMAGTLTLTTSSKRYQNLDPDGSARNVDLPTNAAGLAFFIVNSGNGGETITVRNASAATVDTIDNGKGLSVIADGTVWISAKATVVIV